MRAHWRHTGTTTDEHHLGIGILGEEVTKRTVYSNFVARLQAEHVGRHDARWQVVTTWWRSGHPDVELDHTLFFRVVGHRVGADGSFLDIRYITPDVELVPVGVEFLLDIKILVFHPVRRTLQLHITTCAEVYILAFGQNQGQLFNESGHVGVGTHGTLPLLDAKHLFGDLDFHVLLDVYLTRQTPALVGLTAGEVAAFSRQHVAAALKHLALALGTGTTTTTGRGKEDIVRSQGLQQLAASWNGYSTLIIDKNTHIASGNQLGACYQNNYHQCQHYGGE